MMKGKKEKMNEEIREIKEGIEQDNELKDGYRYIEKDYGKKGEMESEEIEKEDMKYYEGKLKKEKILEISEKKKMKKGNKEWIREKEIIKEKK